MFELVEHQPSHFSSPDVLNLTPGNAYHCWPFKRADAHGLKCSLKE